MPVQKHGAVAILDALGAATYTDDEIHEFLKSRQKVMDLLDSKSEGLAERLDVSQIKTYTFNDTILIVLQSRHELPTRDEIRAFATMLRKFLVDSLAARIMFRGSISIGPFYEVSNSNTILGKAVTDAAAWYDKAEWMGAIATPHASIYIDHLMERDSTNWGHLLVRHEVPLKGGVTRSLWTLNWPKVFWVENLTPCLPTETQREAFLKFLSRFRVPFGAEQKHFNTIAFFDAVAKQLQLRSKKRTA